MSGPSGDDFYPRESVPERLIRHGINQVDYEECQCKCADSEAKNDELNRKLRAEVAKQLGLPVSQIRELARTRVISRPHQRQQAESTYRHCTISRLEDSQWI